MLHFNEQRRFFYLWEKSVVYDVVCLVKAEAGLDCCCELSPKNITEILNRAGMLLDGVEELENGIMGWSYRRLPLCEEVKNNLDEMEGGERGGYIYTLIEPFRDYMGVKFDGVEDVEKAKRVFRYCCYGDGRSMAGKFLEMYERIAGEYGRMLDAVLLGCGINLQWYERALGVPSLAGWRKNEREMEAASYLNVDIREAARVVDEALPRLDAERPTAGRNGAGNGQTWGLHVPGGVMRPTAGQVQMGGRVKEASSPGGESACMVSIKRENGEKRPGNAKVYQGNFTTFAMPKM